MNVFGVDVYEGTGTVDWGAVKSSQATFGICKATEYHKDSRFDRNWQDIKSAGLDGRGAYHFLLTNRDVGGQAKMFVDTVGPLGPGDFGPIVDYEPDPDNGGAIPSAAQMAAYVDHLLQAYPDRRPIIYGNAGDLAGLGSQFVGSCDLWIAHYGPNNGHPPNIQPPTAAWPRYHLWQYTSVGTVAGTAANCDLSLFNGSLDDLRQMVKEGVRPMFDPPLQIVAWCLIPGGLVAVAPDGAVFCEPANLYQGGANGQAYFIGHKAARIQPNARGGYDIIDTHGSNYSYPT